MTGKSAKISSRTSTRKSAGKTVRRRPTKPDAASAATPSVASQLPPVSAADIDAAQRKFEEGIIARGEAVPVGAPLHSGVTHVIVGKRPDGSPVLKRRRFSAR